MAGGKVVLQLVERADEDVVDARADERGRNVERRVEQKAGLLKVKVAQQRMTQMARADHDEPVPLVHAENMTDLCAQLQNVVAVALLTELAEAAQVLADLRGGDIHALAERARRNAHDALGMQIV